MRKPKTPTLVHLAITTTITIIAWIGFSVYRTLTTPALVDVPAEILQPLNPELNVATLDKIEQRVFFKEEEIAEFSSQAAPIPVATATPSAEAETAPAEAETEAGSSKEATE